MELKDVKYGLVVLDVKNPNEDGSIPILHFVGFRTPPGENEIKHLREELKTNKEFDLIDKIDDLVIYFASEDIMNWYHNLSKEEVKTED